MAGFKFYDNLHIDINGDSDGALSLVCQLILGYAHITGFRHDTDKNRLILYRSDSPIGMPLGYSKLLSPCRDVNRLKDLINEFLDVCVEPLKEDEDCENKRGWRISTGPVWGMVDNDYRTLVAVEPIWTRYPTA